MPPNKQSSSLKSKFYLHTKAKILGDIKASFLHNNLDQMIFSGPIQPGLFYDFSLSS